MNEELMICLYQGFGHTAKFFVPRHGYTLAIALDSPEFDKKVCEIITKYNITEVNLVGMEMLTEKVNELVCKNFPELKCIRVEANN